MKRTLYECLNAKVYDSRIKCRHQFLSSASYDGSLTLLLLEKGDPLVMAVCQDCPDFISMGEPVPEKEKGWIRS